MEKETNEELKEQLIAISDNQKEKWDYIVHTCMLFWISTYSLEKF